LLNGRVIVNDSEATVVMSFAIGTDPSQLRLDFQTPQVIWNCEFNFDFGAEAVALQLT